MRQIDKEAELRWYVLQYALSSCASFACLGRRILFVLVQSDLATVYSCGVESPFSHATPA